MDESTREQRIEEIADHYSFGESSIFSLSSIEWQAREAGFKPVYRLKHKRRKGKVVYKAELVCERDSVDIVKACADIAARYENPDKALKLLDKGIEEMRKIYGKDARNKFSRALADLADNESRVIGNLHFVALKGLEQRIESHLLGVSNPSGNYGISCFRTIPEEQGGLYDKALREAEETGLLCGTI